jgi:hypothetical protein
MRRPSLLPQNANTKGKKKGKGKKARTPGARVRRTAAIVLLVGGVALETVANVVQLAESPLVNETVAKVVHTPLTHRARDLIQQLWP